MTDTNLRIRRGEDFSATERLHTWMRNDKWKAGYEAVASGLTEYLDSNSEYWSITSALTEDVMKDFYFKIDSFIGNIADVDTCEPRQLASIAKSLGYTGNTQFLEFNYPVEIQKLLNLFSINSNYVKNSAKILTDSAASTLLPQLSGAVCGEMGGYVNVDIAFNKDVYPYQTSGAPVFSDEAWAAITELSGNPILYKYLDTDKYYDYVEDMFGECLSAGVNLKYRHAEVYTTPEDQQYYTTTGYIWQYIADQLYGDALFMPLDSKSDEVKQLKLRLGLSSAFPVAKIVNDIQSGTDRLANYTTSEQLVLQAELDYRKSLLERAFPISRFSLERETRVREYFQFIKQFNNSNYLASLEEYDLDSKYMMLNSSESTLGEGPLVRVRSNMESGTPIECLIRPVQSVRVNDISTYTVNGAYIAKSAEFLRNLAIKISYFRENVKTLAKKNFLIGTPIGVKTLIAEIFYKYIYGSDTNWKVTTGQLPEIRNPGTLEVIIREYFDSTEYFNIITNADYTDVLSANTLNARYWPQSSADVIGGEFATTDILDAYSSILDKSYDINYPSGGGSPQTSADRLGYVAEFVSALGEVATPSAYHSGSRSTVRYITDETAAYGKLISPNFGFTVPWLMVGAAIQYDDNYVDHKVGRVSAHIASAYDVSAFLAGTTEIRTIEIPPPDGSPEDTPPTLSTVTITGEGTSGIISRFDEFFLSGDISDAAHYYNDELVNDWHKIMSDGIDFTVDSLYVVAQFNGFIASNPDDIRAYATSAANGTLSPYSEFIRYSSLREFSADITANLNSVNTYLDPCAAVLLKLHGGLSADAPHYNSKNVVHPSYALHPNLKNFSRIDDIAMLSFSNILERMVDKLSRQEFIAFVDAALDSSGNTVDSWKDENVDLAGYQTFYEWSNNLNQFGETDSRIDMDGPWNPLALESFLESPSAFIESVSAGTNEYYLKLGLDESDYHDIAAALARVSGNTETSGNTISTLKNKHVYQYCVDPYENHYMLYKENNEFDEYGEIWVRHKNHPLALPFIYQVDSPSYQDIQCAAINAYDFGINDSTLWINCNSNVQGKLAFATLAKDGYRISALQSKTSESFIEVPDGKLLIGVASHGLQIIPMFVSVNNDLELPESEVTPSAYTIKLTGMVYEPGKNIKQINVGSIDTIRQVFSREYDSAYPANVWRLSKSQNSMFVAYEYVRDLSAKPSNVLNKTSSNSIATQFDGPDTIDAYENGIAAVRIDLQYSNSEIISMQIPETNGISLYEPHGSAGYLPLLVDVAEPNVYQDVYSELNGQTEISVQTFMTHFPSDAETTKCPVEIYPDLGKFKIWYEDGSQLGYEDGETLQASEDDEVMTAEQFPYVLFSTPRLIIEAMGSDNVFGDSIEFPVARELKLEFDFVGQKRGLSTLISPKQFYRLSGGNKYYKVKPTNTRNYRLVRKVTKLMHTFFVWDGGGKIRMNYIIKDFSNVDVNSTENNLSTLQPEIMY